MKKTGILFVCILSACMVISGCGRTENTGGAVERRIFLLPEAGQLLQKTGSAAVEAADKQTDPMEQEVPVQSEDESAFLTLAEKKDIFLEQKLAAMSREEKVGQLLFCAFRKTADGVPITVWNEELSQTISRYHLGGVILFGENIDTKEQTRQLVTDICRSVPLRPFIGIDEEGGRVSRLHTSGKLDAEKIPTAQEIGNTGNSENARQAGLTIGRELAELGIDVDFAPIADINSNPANQVIGDRAFSGDPRTAGEMAAAFEMGLSEYEVSGAAKHFPGHGDTKEDSHKGMAATQRTLEEMEAAEWVPFQMLIDNGVDFVMVGHITAPQASADGLPASLSQEMITGQLRNRLGFEGIIITDALDMGAVTAYDQTGNAALMALMAGADMALMPADLEQTFEAILDAVQQGELTEQLLNEKVKRILSLKYDKGYFADEL